MGIKPYYDRDGITIYCGDCREIVPQLEQIDAVISDPPYGMNWDTDTTRFTGGKGSHNRIGERVSDDDKPFDPKPWLEYRKVLLWGCNHYASNLPVGTTIVWLKKSDAKFGVMLSDAELAWMSGGHGVYVHRQIWDGCAREGGENGKHFHPTQKPVGLMKWCIGKTGVNTSEVILDPFMGSGTTLVAAKELGIRAVGIELSERYCEIAAKRLAQGVLKFTGADCE